MRINTFLVMLISASQNQLTKQDTLKESLRELANELSCAVLLWGIKDCGGSCRFVKVVGKKTHGTLEAHVDIQQVSLTDTCDLCVLQQVYI